jgi:hypothetical protein
MKSLSSEQASAPATRYVSYIVLFDGRLWTSTEGKPLAAKLIAFEDLVVEAPKATAEPTIPQPTSRPTVVRSGKVRLLVDGKPTQVALDRLSQSDRDFVAQIQAAIAKKTSAAD